MNQSKANVPFQLKCDNTKWLPLAYQYILYSLALYDNPYVALLVKKDKWKVQ